MDKKFCLVHDWVVNIGGAEKCLREFCSLYPDAPLFSLLAVEESLRKLDIDPERVTSSFIERLPFARKKYRSYLPFFPLAVEQFDLSGHDVVISSSHVVAKGVLVDAMQLHFCYCHSPVRYAWDLYHQYVHDFGLKKGMKAGIVKLILHYLRMWDVSSANRVDYFIANSNFIAKRIRRVYGREAKVIYPPVNTEQFVLEESKEDYYLTVSRMVPYKKIGMIVEAFSFMPEKKLVVIGDGPEMKNIRAKATQNVEILGFQATDVVHDYMQRARAFIFAAKEDFGIVPLEAQACGTPVIAFGEGGARETILDGVTGVFFDHQSCKSLIQAVKRFERTQDEFAPVDISSHAQSFSRERFRREFSEYVKRVTTTYFDESSSHRKNARQLMTKGE